MFLLKDNVKIIWSCKLNPYTCGQNAAGFSLRFPIPGVSKRDVFVTKKIPRCVGEILEWTWLMRHETVYIRFSYIQRLFKEVATIFSFFTTSCEKPFRLVWTMLITVLLFIIMQAKCTNAFHAISYRMYTFTTQR